MPTLYRESQHVPAWSATVALDVRYEVFEATVLASAQHLKYPFSGLLEYSPDGVITSFTAIRFPSQAGIPVGVCAGNVEYLAGWFGAAVQEDQQPRSLCRAILNLADSYYSTGEMRTVEQVSAALGAAFAVRHSELFTTPIENPTQLRVQSVVVADTAQSHLEELYSMADLFGLGRLMIHDFPAGKAYLVETRHAA